MHCARYFGESLAAKIPKNREETPSLYAEAVLLHAAAPHNNIVAVEFMVWNDFASFLLECLGANLSDAVAFGGLLEQADAETLVREMISALFHLEMTQILHRDVKPGNVAQCEDGSINNWKLLDFDFACYLDSLQHVGYIGGTMAYYAPAVLSGRYDMRRDVSALGMSLAEVSRSLLSLAEWLLPREESRRPYASDVAASLGHQLA